jgi:Protein of unknown function (DUF3617)
MKFTATSLLVVSTMATAGLLVTADARADDLPARKPGLWEITIQSDRAPAKRPMGAVQQCMDEATEKLMRDFGGGGAKRDCARQDMRREGGKLVVDSVCKIDVGAGSSTATTHAVISGDFNTAYHMESHSTYSPPFMGHADGAMTMDAKWLGPCQAGQKPGDVIMPGGMKMNLIDAMGAAGKK